MSPDFSPLNLPGHVEKYSSLVFPKEQRDERCQFFVRSLSLCAFDVVFVECLKLFCDRWSYFKSS